MERTHEQHPSYVQVSFSRTESSTGEVFYGSNIKANSYVTLRIEQSEKVNEGYKTWFFPRKRILQLRLSPTQFAELLTTMNCGSGVTGTLEHLEPDNIPRGRLPSPPYNNTLDSIEKHISSFEGTLLNEKFVNLETKVESLSISAKQKKELLDQVGSLKQELKSNLPYYIQLAQEQIAKTLNEAKGVIDSFYTSICMKLGIKKLKESTSYKEITFPTDEE